MDTTFKPIDHTALTEQLAAGKSQRLHALGRKDGWLLIVRRGKAAQALAARDGTLRIFSTLNRLDDYLRDHGIQHFLLDISELDKTSDDPEIVERLREAAKAAEYDAWFRQQVQESLSDSGPTIPDSIVEEKFAARRAELSKKLTKV